MSQRDDQNRSEKQYGRREMRPRKRGVRRFGGRRKKGKGGGRRGGKQGGRGAPREQSEPRHRDEGGRVSIPREVVLPGDVLATDRTRVGRGAFKDGETVLAAQLGVKALYRDQVAVIPLAGRYIPKSGDEVIGMVVDIMPTFWLVEINSPYPAPLYADESPWKVDFGDTGRYLNVGDLVLAEVSSVDFMKRVRLTMDGRGLRRLSGGQVIEVSHSKVPRIIGKGGSMIKMLKERSGCRIYVGQNGRIWLEGEPGGIQLAVEAIRIVEENAHTHGLTERISNHLKERLSEGAKQEGPAAKGTIEDDFDDKDVS
jgi:exosome complex component RRP4